MPSSLEGVSANVHCLLVGFAINELSGVMTDAARDSVLLDV